VNRGEQMAQEILERKCPSNAETCERMRDSTISTSCSRNVFQMPVKVNEMAMSEGAKP
jgi:hypothetical protein